MKPFHPSHVLRIGVVGAGVYCATTASAADVGRAIAGAATASVASEVCPGYTLGITPALRLAAAGIDPADLKPGGKHYTVMMTGFAIMTAQHQRNAAAFCAYAFKIRNDMD
jgi:hypothetical protein